MTKRLLHLDPERVAIVRALQLGDMLVAVPALRAIRARFPRAEITLVGLPWSASFAERFSAYIDRWVAFPGWPGIVETPYRQEVTAKFLERERGRRYDLVIGLHGSGKHSNGFARALSSGLTAGFHDGEPAADRPDISAPYPHHLPEIRRNLRLAELLGCQRISDDLEFPVSRDEIAEAGTLLGPATTAKPLVGVHPGASAPARRWPVERFAWVADRLANVHGATVVLTGGPEDVETVGRVAARMQSASLNLAGRTTLGSLAAVIDRCDLYVSNDTGPAHIAIARSTPSTIIFGPADVARWGPLNRERHRAVHHPVVCNPCSYQVCPIDHRCMERVEADEVWHLSSGLLEAVVA